MTVGVFPVRGNTEALSYMYMPRIINRYFASLKRFISDHSKDRDHFMAVGECGLDYDR